MSFFAAVRFTPYKPLHAADFFVQLVALLTAMCTGEVGVALIM